MKVLVYGWGGHGNLGDELFQEVFRSLFPTFDFIFTDYLDDKIMEGQKAIFLGGGSFLDQARSIKSSFTNAMLKKPLPLFYLGVGSETNIDPIHWQLLKWARLIVFRSADKLEEVKKINQNTLLAPDLVYCHPAASTNKQPISKSILFLPNINIVPNYSEPQWKAAAWSYFKFELSQVLDQLIEDGHTLRFFPMCVSDSQDDNWAAVEVMNKMKRGSHSFLLRERPKTIQETIDLFAGYEIIITQRFHGIVLSEMAKRPCLTIAHHDKLSVGDPDALSMYGMSKKLFLQQFNRLLETKFVKPLPLNLHLWRDIATRIENILGTAGSNEASGHLQR
jgi:polysaccharide pyruvyl transferase WcaK-like protein